MRKTRTMNTPPFLKVDGVSIQTSLDRYTEDGEIVEVGEECIGEAPISSVEVEGCGYCRLRGEGRYKLHPGALNLYYKDGGLKAMADLDHVYGKCREGLKENIRFLYRVLRDLKSRGFDAVVVGKAFDDLYAWVRGSGESGKKLDYEGFSILLSRFVATVEEFEKMNWYMQVVDEKTILEVLECETYSTNLYELCSLVDYKLIKFIVSNSL